MSATSRAGSVTLSACTCNTRPSGVNAAATVPGAIAMMVARSDARLRMHDCDRHLHERRFEPRQRSKDEARDHDVRDQDVPQHHREQPERACRPCRARQTREERTRRQRNAHRNHHRQQRVRHRQVREREPRHRDCDRNAGERDERSHRSAVRGKARNQVSRSGHSALILHPGKARSRSVRFAPSTAFT